MKNDLTKITSDMDAYYSQKSQLGQASQKVGWKNLEAQTVRFEQIAKVIDRQSGKPFRINDIGCGFGDLAGFLSDNGYRNFEYAGYDISTEMIDEATRRHGDKQGHSFAQIKDYSEVGEADYCVASGIFNLSFGMSKDDWISYILDTINLMHARSSAGFSFNCLTSYSDPEFMRKELFYSDPCFLFDYCKKNISRNVSLLHDYGEYDFTIIVRKNIS